MIISLQKHKEDKMVEAAKAALAAEATKPACQMDTVFLQKCIEIIHQHSEHPGAEEKRPSPWRAFRKFLCGE